MRQKQIIAAMTPLRRIFCKFCSKNAVGYVQWVADDKFAFLCRLHVDMLSTRIKTRMTLEEGIRKEFGKSSVD